MGWKVQTGLDLAEHMFKELKKTKSNNIPALVVFHSDEMNFFKFRSFSQGVPRCCKPGSGVEVSPLLYVHSSLSKAFLSSPHITLLVSSPFCFYVTTPERSGENRSYMLRSLKCLLLDLLQQRFTKHP